MDSKTGSFKEAYTAQGHQSLYILAYGSTRILSKGVGVAMAFFYSYAGEEGGFLPYQR